MNIYNEDSVPTGEGVGEEKKDEGGSEGGESKPEGEGA